MTSENAENSQDIFKHSNTFEDNLRYLKTSQDISKYSRMFQTF